MTKCKMSTATPHHLWVIRTFTRVHFRNIFPTLPHTAGYTTPGSLQSHSHNNISQNVCRVVKISLMYGLFRPAVFHLSLSTIKRINKNLLRSLAYSHVKDRQTPVSFPLARQYNMAYVVLCNGLEYPAKMEEKLSQYDIASYTAKRH